MNWLYGCNVSYYPMLCSCSLLSGPSATLESLNVSHGEIIYLLYHFERTVEPAVKLKEFDRRPFGAYVTVGWEKG